MIKLNLGCAQDIKDDYINIDLYDHPLVKKADVRDLSFLQDKSVDEIYAKDVLEHIPLIDGKKAVKEWSRVLKSGGKIFIQTINIDKQLEAYSKGVWSIEDLNHMIFAGLNWVNQKSKCEDFHKCAYNSTILTQILELNNIKVENIEYDQIDQDLVINPRSHNLNLMIYGVKK
jgi:predicted SAM-dependent methyltransferase